MREFTDSKGRILRISITIGSVMRVKSQTGVDLLQIEKGEKPLITRLWEDELLMAEILACLLSGQIEGLTEAEMYDCFDGETMIKAKNCFYEELIDFFQKSARTERAELVRKQQALIKEVVQMATEKLKEADTTRTVSGMIYGSAPGKLE
jgi:hypothetical protein